MLVVVVVAATMVLEVCIMVQAALVVVATDL
jgi:hypothetical protein